MREDRERVKAAYNILDRADQIILLEWIYQDNKQLWDYISMPDSLRKFYSNEKRPEHKGEING